MHPEPTIIEPLAAIAHPLTGAGNDYDPVIEKIGTATVVLIGEATHGTHDFYRHRAEMTKRLIQEKGFNAVAIEGEWPETERVAPRPLQPPLFGDDRRVRDGRTRPTRAPRREHPVVGGHVEAEVRGSLAVMGAKV